MSKLSIFIRQHKLAFIFALLAGAIYLAPHVFFICSMGEDYQGIPMIQTANEEYYIARMREVVDSHWLVGSPVFYEYKGEWPLTPPLGEFLYSLPTLLFGIDLMFTLIASKFILSFILFLLAYFLTFYLLAGEDSLAKKVSALGSALLITLGYDLADYRSIFLYLSGQKSPEDFLIWSRPVNPVLGAIFLFAFLLFFVLTIKNIKYRKITIVLAAIFLALMVMSYFFSWGIAISVLGVIILILILKKNYQEIKRILFIIGLAAILTFPYWYISWQSSKSPWYSSSVLRSGLFYTHYPVLNKIMLATLVFFIFITLIERRQRRKEDKNARFLDLAFWQWFCLSLILGSLLAYNQQVLTGLTIWPYHFVQYTIPLAMIVFCCLLFNLIKKWQYYFWLLTVMFLIISSLIFGLFIQYKTYQNKYNYYSKLQTYEPVFEWLNEQGNDCVVLDRRDKNQKYNWGGYILAFTHCDTYANNWAFSLMPDERLYHNYLVHLRLQGVTPGILEEYLKANSWEDRDFIFSNWKDKYNLNDFPDFRGSLLEERRKGVPKDFKEFYAKDFKTELKKYRIDFIFSTNPLEEEIARQLPGIELAFSYNNIYLYRLK